MKRFIFILVIVLTSIVNASASDDHGSSIGTATTVSAVSTTSGTIDTAGDNDYFRVTIPSSGVLLVNSTGSLDTYGYLLNARGARITLNDDGGASTNFKIVRNIPAGTYYIKVRAYSRSVTGTYSLNVEFADSSLQTNSVDSNQYIRMPVFDINGDDHGRNISTATTVSTTSTTPGRLDLRGDNDYFRITVPSSGELVVNSTGTLDTYGYLLNSNGDQIAFNDDGGLSTNFKIVRNITAGTYYVRLRAYSRSVTGRYSLVVNFSSDLIVADVNNSSIPFSNADDHGDNINTATPIDINSTTSGVLEVAGDNDYFRVTIPSSGTLVLNSTGSLNTYGYLLNSNGYQIASNDNNGTDTNFMISRDVAAGTYYVRVNSYLRELTGSYSLDVNFTSSSPVVPVVATDDHGSDLNTSTAVGTVSTTSGVLEVAGDNDYFRVTIPSAGSLVLNSTGLLDTYGYLLNSDGDQITRNDDGATVNFMISVNVEAGTYYIKVRAYSRTATGNYSLVVNFTASDLDEEVLDTTNLSRPTSIDIWNSWCSNTSFHTNSFTFCP